MVDSSDEIKSSRSIYGKDFPNFEILNEKIVSAVKEHPEFPTQQENQLRRTQKPIKKRIGSCEEDRSISESTTILE